MASLEDDVLLHGGAPLFELRQSILACTTNKTPTQLVDEAISGTVVELGKQFKLEAIGVCEYNGDPHYCDTQSLIKYYWDKVSEHKGMV